MDDIVNDQILSRKVLQALISFIHLALFYLFCFRKISKKDKLNYRRGEFKLKEKILKIKKISDK